MIKYLPLFLVVTLSLASPFQARADILNETCKRQVLSPEQRTDKSDIVFEGKVTSAVCQCHALANGEDTYGAEAECTDIIAVIKVSKGEVGPEFTLKNMVFLDPDPSVTMSRSECQDRVDDRDKKMVGENDIYYIKKSGDHFQSVPVSACD